MAKKTIAEACKRIVEKKYVKFMRDSTQSDENGIKKDLNALRIQIDCIDFTSHESMTQDIKAISDSVDAIIIKLTNSTDKP